MFALPEGAYPTASRRFIEAVRDYRRKMKGRPEPKQGSREWYASMRDERFKLEYLLSHHFEQPLLYTALHRINWGPVERPKLFVTLGIDSREGLYLIVRSSECIHALWGFGFRETYVADAGDFRQGFHDLRLLGLPLEDGFAWACTAGWQVRQPQDIHRFRDERHLCVLAIQAKLHHLSLFFNCQMDVRPVEFGPDFLIDWREYPEARDQTDTPDQPELSSTNWGPARLTALLLNSGLTLEQLYEFGSNYLASLDKALRPEVLGQYLCNSHTGAVTQEDVVQLLKLSDPKIRAKQWLADLAVDERFPHMKRQRYYWLREFATAAGFTEDEALAWILKHHPLTYETYAPSHSSIRRILDSRDARKLSSKATAQLDGKLAARIVENEYRVTGIRAQYHLEKVAQSVSFADFDELVAWSKSGAPKTHRAALDLAEMAVRRTSEAKAAASAKRQAAKRAEDWSPRSTGADS